MTQTYLKTLSSTMEKFLSCLNNMFIAVCIAREQDMHLNEVTFHCSIPKPTVHNSVTRHSLQNVDPRLLRTTTFPEHPTRKT